MELGKYVFSRRCSGDIDVYGISYVSYGECGSEYLHLSQILDAIELAYSLHNTTKYHSIRLSVRAMSRPFRQHPWKLDKISIPH